MLADKDPVATLAVKDLAQARRFYENTLGFQAVAEQGEEVVTYRSGAGQLNVYRSEFAGTNKATAVAWEVDDVDAEVARLGAKGVQFERYEMDGMRLEGDVHVWGEGEEEFRTAWFKDPDGNILNLMSGG